MEKFEYKYEAGEQGVTLAGSGDLMDMATHIATAGADHQHPAAEPECGGGRLVPCHAGRPLYGPVKPRVGGRAGGAAGDRLLQRHTRKIAGGGI